MIFDTLKNIERYRSLSRNFRTAIDYLLQTDLATMPPGRYQIAGDHVYIMVQQPTLIPWEQGRWEAHKRYADIQIVISGWECIGFMNADNAKILIPYNAVSDVLFYEENVGNRGILSAGQMMVFFPSDAHRPCIRPDDDEMSVHKAVVKVLLSDNPSC